MPFPISDDNEAPIFAEKLAELISFETVSYSDYGAIDLREYQKLPGYFEKNFPHVWAECSYYSLNGFSHIFKWDGSDPELKPALLLAHFDVVPADASDWSFDPFEGGVEGGFVRGRGSLDTKCTLAGIMEAAELLIREGFRPKRTFYFAFGGDEETYGVEGAQKIAAHFKEAGIYFDYVLDEGTIVASGMLSDIAKPIALIGLSEKGYADIVLQTAGKGGHASMPPKQNPAVELVKGISKIEKNRCKRRITYTVKRFLHSLIPYVSFLKKIIYGNIWLFGPIIKSVMSKGGQTRALIETTKALTVLESGNKENVIPLGGRAVYNIRILPGETVEEVLHRFQKKLRRNSIDVSVLDEREVNNPVWETSAEDELYRRFEQVITDVFPEAITAPFLSTVTTDSKYYRDVTERIYRFVPIILTADDLGLIHGSDERISFDNLRNILRFYTKVMEEL